MNNLRQWFLLGVFLFKSIRGYEICDIADVQCTTKGAQYSYRNILAAFKGESPDPLLYKDKLEVNLGTSKVEVSNITIEGMKKCNAEKLLCRPSDSTFHYFLYCPELVLNARIQTEGDVGTILVNGSAETRVTAVDYMIIIKGVYEKFISKVDQLPHVNVQTYELDFEPRGKVTFETVKLLTGDKEKFELVVKFLNDNWMDFEKIARKPLLNVIYRKFYKSYNEALNTIPLKEILPKL